MLKILNELLQTSISDALEVMAFITALPPLEIAMPQGPLVLTEITYEGARSGKITLVSPVRFGALLVANLLGCEVDSPEAMSRAPDALRELINITCGTLLKKSMATERGLVEMNIPSQCVFPPEDWQAWAEDGALALEADGCLILCRHE